MMKAQIISEGPYSDPYEIIEVNGHNIQYGGRAGDGYCHAHNSFYCAEHLTEEEKEAVRHASNRN